MNQAEWDRDLRKLMVVPVVARRVLQAPARPIDSGDAKLGGESGPGFRPLDMNALRTLRDQCARNGHRFSPQTERRHARQGERLPSLMALSTKNFPPMLRENADVAD